VGARVVADGEQLGSFVEIPASDCVLVIARGGNTVTDIDLYAYTDGGDRLASDEAPDPRAAVIVCPPHPRRVYVVARGVSGEGVVALGVMRVPASKADAVSKALDVRGRPGQDTGKLAQWPGLERAIREHRKALGATWEDVRRVAVPLSSAAHTSVSTRVEANRCIDVLIVPSDEVQSIDALVVDDEGRTLARGKPPGHNRAFVLCTAAPQEVTVKIRARASSGLAAVIIGRSDPGAMTALSESTWVAGVVPLVPLEQAEARHEKRMASLQLGEPDPSLQGKAEVGRTASLPLALPAGCARVDVVGAAPMGRFSALLWDTSGNQLASMRGGEYASTFVCGAARKASVEVKALDRAGAFAVQVRTDDKPPPELMAHPVAASHLLRRLEAAVGPIDAQRAKGARVLEVAQKRRTTETMRLPANVCSDVVVALDAAATLATLSIERGSVTTASEGEKSAHQRVCVGAGKHVAKIAVSVAAGKGKALLVAVPSTP
jgi:hypothetical protein